MELHKLSISDLWALKQHIIMHAERYHEDQEHEIEILAHQKIVLIAQELNRREEMIFKKETT